MCLCFDRTCVLMASSICALHQSLQKMKELISDLDTRKNECMFKGISKHFHQVFSQLVRGGHSFLGMMTKEVCFVCCVAFYASIPLGNIALCSFS